MSGADLRFGANVDAAKASGSRPAVSPHLRRRRNIMDFSHGGGHESRWYAINARSRRAFDAPSAVGAASARHAAPRQSQVQRRPESQVMSSV